MKIQHKAEVVLSKAYTWGDVRELAGNSPGTAYVTITKSNAHTGSYSDYYNALTFTWETNE